MRNGTEWQSFLVLGIGLLDDPEFQDKEHPILGWCNAPSFQDPENDLGPFMCGWDHARLGRWKELIGYCGSSQAFRDRITGAYDGSCGNPVGDEAKAAWAQACNQTQWKAVHI